MPLIGFSLYPQLHSIGFGLEGVRLPSVWGAQEASGEVEERRFSAA